MLLTVASAFPSPPSVPAGWEDVILLPLPEELCRFSSSDFAAPSSAPACCDGKREFRFLFNFESFFLALAEALDSAARLAGLFKPASPGVAVFSLSFKAGEAFMGSLVKPELLLLFMLLPV